MGATSSSLAERLTSAVLAPSEMVRAKLSPAFPWVDALVILALANALMIWGFWQSNTGQNLMQKSHAKVVELAKTRLSPRQYEDFIARPPDYAGRPLQLALRSLPGPFVFTFVFALVLQLALNVGFVSSAPLRPFLSVIAHAYILLIIGAAVSFLIMTLSRDFYGGTTLYPTFGDLPQSFLKRFLSQIDVFTVWWLVVIGLGCGGVFGKRATGFIVALLLIYVGFGGVTAFLTSINLGSLVGHGNI